MTNLNAKPSSPLGFTNLGGVIVALYWTNIINLPPKEITPRGGLLHTGGFSRSSITCARSLGGRGVAYMDLVTFPEDNQKLSYQV